MEPRAPESPEPGRRGTPAHGRALLGRIDLPVAGAFLVAVMATVVFARLFDALREQERMVGIDDHVSSWMAAHRTPALTSLMKLATTLAEPWLAAVVVVVVGVLLVRRGHPRAAVFLVLATVGTAVLTTVAKLVVARPRPPLPYRIVDASGYSFPSGHSSQAMALYGSLAIIAVVLARRWWVRVLAVLAAAVIIALVGCSRVYLGVHFPSDVLAGWCVAAAWLAMLAVAGRLLLARDEVDPSGDGDGSDQSSSRTRPSRSP